MINGLTSYTNLYFYEEPIPIIIGNLPFNDFQTNIDEYQYKKIYKVFGNRQGIVHYSEYFNNYEMIFYDRNLDYSYLYPKLKINGHSGDPNHTFILNPYFNDINGICSYISEYSTSNPTKFIYNTDENAFEWSFGQDFQYFDGLGFNTNIRNLKNVDYSYGYYTNDIDIKSVVITTKYQENRVNGFNFDSLNSNNLGDIGYLKNLNTNSWYPSATINFEDKERYLRNDLVKDLDHEDNNSIPNLLGVYTSTKSSSNYVIGAWVLGNEDANTGRFIGISKDYYGQNTLTSSDKTYPWNCFKLLNIDSELKNNCYVWYGSTYNLDIPRHIVRLRSKDLTSPYNVNRYFILEGNSKNPLDYKKFWYLDFNEASKTSIDTTPATLFTPNIKYKSTNYEKLTFKWYNEEDDEVKNDIELYAIGLTRKNPIKMMFGRNSLLNLTGGSSSDWKEEFTYNTFITNWMTSNTQIIKDE